MAVLAVRFTDCCQLMVIGAPASSSRPKPKARRSRLAEPRFTFAVDAPAVAGVYVPAPLLPKAGR